MKAADSPHLVVIDASAVVDFVLQLPSANAVARELRRADGIAVPAHFDLEAMSALRTLEGQGVIDDVRARRALRQVMSLRARRCALRPLSSGIWRLRGNMTVYDAAYVVLAETTGSTLVTTDPKWARVPGLGVPITTV